MKNILVAFYSPTVRPGNYTETVIVDAQPPIRRRCSPCRMFSLIATIMLITAVIITLSVVLG